MYVDNNNSYNTLNDRKIWLRGVILKDYEEFFTVFTSEENTVILKKTSLEIVKAGTMTPEYDWRSNLEPFDLVDSFDRGRWFPATIIYAKRQNNKGLIKVDYKIGFRLYLDRVPNWAEYSRYWNHRSFSLDNQGNKYIGDSEGMDELIPSFSKRIQK